MKQFHSTVSRRDFMKGLGLTGAGLGAAAAAAPVFKDLDDAVAGPTADFKRAWYVKEVDKPTTEVDWSVLNRFDGREVMWVLRSWAKYVGVDKVNEILAASGQQSKDGVKNNEPSMTLRDCALATAAGVYNWPQDLSSRGATCVDGGWGGGKTWVGFEGYNKDPEAYWGVPKWTASPDENLRMMRSVFRFFGAAEIGVMELGEKEKKLIFTHNAGTASMSRLTLKQWPPPEWMARPIVFEDVDRGYHTDSKLVIPNKPLWVVSIVVPMSKEMFRHGTGKLKSAANVQRYSLHSAIQTKVQAFLEGIGYQGLGYPTRAYGAMPAQAPATLSGMCEMARNNNACINPEYGSVVGYFTMITDLPMTPTKPIDAGNWRFCHTCNKCAESCPAQAISYDKEPSWEIPSPSSAPNMAPDYSGPGKKMFWTDIPNCKNFSMNAPGCATCMGNCVFNVDDHATVHEYVKATLSTTSLFNGFLWNADKIFGYGLREGEEMEWWWNQYQPAYAFDSTI